MAKEKEATLKVRPLDDRVVAVGPGKLLDSGKRSAVAVSTGDEVLFGRYAGSDVTVERKEVKILRESDILAKVVK